MKWQFEEFACRYAIAAKLGNFPQAFTHIGLINTALYLHGAHDPGERAAEAPKSF
jgi:hypothetical protein